MALIITQAGLAALATAESTGSKLQATHMAVGDGNGQPVSHTSQSLELLGETWRGELQEIKVVDSGEVEFIAHIPFAVGGWYMREAAIYAADTLLAIGSHPEVWKPDPEAPDKVELLVTAPVKFTNTDVINLTVDTTKVLASQEMVISAVAQHDEDNNAHAGALSALKDHPADTNAHKALFQAIIDQLPGSASTSGKGLVELATNAETVEGNHPLLVVTTTGLASVLAGKSDTGHGHGIAGISGLQTALDSKANKFKMLIIEDQKPAGTNGGTFTSGAWRTRDLNTIKTNEIQGASLANNRITLPAGKYYVEASAPAQSSNVHKIAFYNVSSANFDILGANEDSTQGGQSAAYLDGIITIGSTKKFELRHRCNATRAGDGFGQQAGYGVKEVYARVTIWKF